MAVGEGSTAAMNAAAANAVAAFWGMPAMVPPPPPPPVEPERRRSERVASMVRRRPVWSSWWQREETTGSTGPRVMRALAPVVMFDDVDWRVLCIALLDAWAGTMGDSVGSLACTHLPHEGFVSCTSLLTCTPRGVLPSLSVTFAVQHRCSSGFAQDARMIIPLVVESQHPHSHSTATRTTPPPLLLKRRTTARRRRHLRSQTWERGRAPTPLVCIVTNV